MSGFWTVSIFWILVLAMIGVALAAVLVPLLRRAAGSDAVDGGHATLAVYRDQLAELESDLARGAIDAAEYQDARLELGMRLDEELTAPRRAAVAGSGGRQAGYALAVVIPAATLLLYALLGTPAALDPAAAAAGEHELATMIGTLEAKLRQDPGDPDGWAMLGRSYEIVGRYPEAERAFAQAVERAPDDAALLTDYAEAVALVQGKVLAGRPVELLEEALRIDPRNEKALELSAIAAAQAGDHRREAGYWRRLERALPADSDARAEVRAAAERAGEMATSGAPAPGATAISGTVRIAPALAAKTAPTDVVWIMAKAPGGRMPLAVLKVEARQLPYRFTLDGAAPMGEGLAAHATVTLTARLSRSGDVMARRGDLEGNLTAVAVGRRDVTLTLDTVVP